jgi:hypothetical protein
VGRAWVIRDVVGLCRWVRYSLPVPPVCRGTESDPEGTWGGIAESRAILHPEGVSSCRYPPALRLRDLAERLAS